MKEMLITPDGLARLTAEVERLRTVEREALTTRIRAAISTDADASANADYQLAREEQALLEARIARLEQRLDQARVERPNVRNDIVDLGERVQVRDLETGAQLEYELVGSFEADPPAGRISALSPIGSALLGRRCGEIAEVDAPGGLRRLEILAAGRARRAAG